MLGRSFGFLVAEVDELRLRNASLSGENERLKQEAGESRSQGDEERRDFERELEGLRAALREATSKVSLFCLFGHAAPTKFDRS